MQIHIRLAEPFWRAVGKRDLTLEAVEGARVKEILDLLRQIYPALDAEMDESPPMVIIGEEEASGDTMLEDEAQVHLVWPIAGG